MTDDNHYLSLIHISDTHLEAAPTETLHGVEPMAHLRALVDEVNRLIGSGVPLDAVVHTGDVVNDGDGEQAGLDSTPLAFSCLQQLQCPCYIVNGNHDNLALLQSQAQLHEHCHVDGLQATLPGCELVFVDARVPPDQPRQEIEDPAGFIPQEALASLESRLETSTSLVAVFLHYPPVALDCDWVDRLMLVRNGEQLHQLLCRHRQKIAGVFFGHVHQSVQQQRDGILYCAAGSAVFQFDTWPTSGSAVVTAMPLAWYSYIRICAAHTTVKQCVVPVAGPVAGDTLSCGF